MNVGPLPPPLMTSEPGSFARKTIVERKPQIIAEVSGAYPYPPQIHEALAAFAREIAAEPIRPLVESAPDVALWNEAWAAHRGRTWLEVPWYFAETFFYRRLMEVVRFYQPGPWRDLDPFAPQKAADLERALPAFLSTLQVDRAAAEREAADPQAAFALRLHDALWGNRADLSNRTIAVTADEGLLGRHADRLVIDHTAHIAQHLAAHRPARVDLVADNSGLELALDLRLIDFLLRSGWVRQVRLHLKHMPFFVSDAMRRDLAHTLERLAAFRPHGAALAGRLRAAIDEGALLPCDDPFWSSCLSFHQLTPEVRAALAGADAVVFKGDVNYRRLLDDRHWPHTAHLADILPDFPASLIVLRTLKGELIVDLQPGQAEALAAQDATWMIDGQRGIVQWVRVQEDAQAFRGADAFRGAL